MTLTGDAIAKLRSAAPPGGSLGGSRWVGVTLIVGGILTAVWTVTSTQSLSGRVTRDVGLFLVIPGLLGYLGGERLGWRADRRAVRNTILLAVFVLPFYLIGSTLPTIRAHYPIWSVSPELGAFVPHALQLFLLVLATETYYRGLLCLGLRRLGIGCVFVSPVVYALAHVYSPPIELVLSGPTDVLFGIVDYDANSLLPSVVAHGIGLIFLDWLVLHDPVVAPSVVLRYLDWLPIPV